MAIHARGGRHPAQTRDPGRARHPCHAGGVIASYVEWPKAKSGALASAIRDAYGGTPRQRPEVYRRHSGMALADRRTMRVFLAHGDADAVVPVDNSRALDAAVRGGTLKYVAMPGGDHDVPLAPWVVKEALDWILPT